MDIMSIAEHLKISLVLFFHSIGDLWNMAHEIFFCMFYSISNKNKKFLKGYSVLMLMYI